ncbi:hypothetical protein MKX01_042803 [Papaver californicum]|nr:hypothetical protein MKX01_042803 [Papaver californicum]
MNSQAYQADNDFKLSGLSRLTTVNWQDERYRRSIIASLVKGVYVLKSDHRQHLKGCEALAPPWWESFNFKLLRFLTDDGDCAPKYVVAFRGTMIKQDSFVGDMKLNINILFNTLHRRSRFVKAMEAVENMVSEKGASNIWLAGHSLGAAIAMLAGKTMAKEGIFLESYLYNPPFIAVPIELIPSRRVRHGLLVACTVVTAGLTIVLKNKQQRQQSEDLFRTLSVWVPNLFLNPSDLICSEYIAHFEHREKMRSDGVGFLANLATRHSCQGLFMNAVGKELWSEEKSHLIPSACVTTSSDPRPHRLSQWFIDNSVSVPKVYLYC